MAAPAVPPCQGLLVQLATPARVAQLQRPEAGGRWQALTFSGETVSVLPSEFSALQEAPGLDFVAGPNASVAAISEAMMASLQRRGYCTGRLLRPRSEADRIQEVVATLTFSRVPVDFEPYYLGRDSREKTVLLDFTTGELSDLCQQSPLGVHDRLLDDLFQTLEPALQAELGVRVEARTNLLVRQTFKDDEEEFNMPAHTEPGTGERESFMGLMKRRRVCVMRFVGPLTGRLTLMPKQGGEEIDIEVQPGSMVVFLTEQYRYSYVCEEGATVALQCWFLAKGPQFEMHDIGGDLEVLARVDDNGTPPPRGEQVLVASMGIMLGGDCRDDLTLWMAVNKAGTDTFQETPITRWDHHTYCELDDQAVAMSQGKSYTKHQGLVEGIEFFDCSFFGISPAEAKAMDPNQRKCLEVSYQCIAGAGYTMRQLKQKAEHIGCFIGTSGVEWGQIPHDMDSAGCGTHEAIIANRLNFALNLKGPSVTSNTACSSGLVAINSAKLYLKYKDFDPLVGCLGGGINLAYSPFPFMGCCGASMLSYRGRSFTFDISADGYGRGEGMACVFLRLGPFSDDIFATLAGAQANQDGRSASITAPNGPSQEKCIKAALREAGFVPPEVDCFECHGTGTALGDPIEVGAFKRIYAAQPRQHTLMVTTSKTNFGHSEAGAGAVGFCKCCLQTMRAEASPNLHLRELNGHIDIENFLAVFTTEGNYCKYTTASSGVSSFGMGGTNAHGMAFNKNTTTGRALPLPDYRRTMLNKIEGMTHADIIMPSMDPEEWETTGMPVEAGDRPKLYQVEVHESGKTIWREVVEEPLSKVGVRFALSGSFNSWGLTDMQPDPTIPNLFFGMIEIGQEGYELFHVVCDDDTTKLYFPEDEPQCPHKIARVKGPCESEGSRQDATWLIESTPGARYRVEFFATEEVRTLTWLMEP